MAKFLLVIVLVGVGTVGAGALVRVAEPRSPVGGDASSRALERAIRRTSEEIARTAELFEDHSTWQKAWSVDSEHFTVRTVDSWFLGNDLGSGLDVMLEHFQTTLALKAAPPGRARIYVVPNVAQYNQLGQNSDQHSSFYPSFFAHQDPDRPVIALFDRNPMLLRMQITHGAVHQFLASAFPNRTPPVWISEGLAAYFSIYWDYEWALTQFERMRADKELIPLSSLFRDDIAAYANGTNVRMLELGLLFYYLLRYRDDTRTTLPEEDQQRGPFRDYLLGTLRGIAMPDSPILKLLENPNELDQDLNEFEFPH